MTNLTPPPPQTGIFWVFPYRVEAVGLVTVGGQNGYPGVQHVILITITSIIIITSITITITIRRTRIHGSKRSEGKVDNELFCATYSKIQVQENDVDSFSCFDTTYGPSLDRQLFLSLDRDLFVG